MQHFDGSRPAHAIVIGGSIVGAATAALLAQRFHRVTIIERDELPLRPGPRGGVPHARHVHALLARGAAELEQLFPGFLDGMVQAGARLVDMGREAAWLTPAGWGVPFESGFVLCCATRDLIEFHVRRRAMALENVTLVDAAAVTDLLTDADRTRVTGIRYRDRRHGPDAPRLGLHADLVVDASGRGSQLPAWLAAIGRPDCRESVVDGHMAYASRFYAMRPDALRGWRAAYVQPQLPGDPRGGILFPVEGGRYHLTLFGYGAGAPPTDDAGFDAFAASLRSSILADALQDATPLTPIVAHRRTENRWRHFHEMTDWPDGLVAVGDSVCCFDPVYGQGMTTGVLGALTFAAAFDAEWRGRAAAPRGFTRRVQRRMAGTVRPAWNLATGEDLRLPATTGGRLSGMDRLMQRYIDRVIAASTEDPRMRRRLLAVMNMTERPESLLHPRAIAGVVRRLFGPPAAPRPLWPERRTAERPAPGARVPSQPIIVSQ